MKLYKDMICNTRKIQIFIYEFIDFLYLNIINDRNKFTEN